jgi:hypothetical protein
MRRSNHGEGGGVLRAIDESGEDYLYPESHFVAIDIPPEAREALSAAS